MNRAFLLLNGGLLAVIALGVLTRAMDAGLACPDWPLCFGDVIPDYHPQVYLEFIHRNLGRIYGPGLDISLWKNFLKQNLHTHSTTRGFGSCTLIRLSSLSRLEDGGGPLR